jgi:putative Mn2+ efflux pump MntP
MYPHTTVTSSSSGSANRRQADLSCKENAVSNNLVVIGLLLGLDSLAVGTGLGMTVPDRHRRRLALAFGICDALASLLGSLAGVDRLVSLPVWEWSGPLVVAGYGLLVLYQVWRSRRMATSPSTSGWLALTVPLCLSLDNLVVGVGADTSVAVAVLVALAFGVASGCLALLGMSLGAGLARRVRIAWLGGAVLVLLSFALLCREVFA